MTHHKSNNIHPTSVIHDNVIIGKGNVIGPYAVIGNVGECRGETERKGKVIIGDNNVINSGVTIDSPVRTDTTKIGSNCFIMTKSHIGHDCILGDNVTIAPGSVVGGVCILEDYVNLGINSSVHQRLHIGESAMIGMSSVITKHVLPFCIVVGSPGKILKCNVIGAKKRNLDYSVFENNAELFLRVIKGISNYEHPLKDMVINFKSKHQDKVLGL